MVIFEILVITTVFIWIRAAFPRYRYDQLMKLTWVVFLPLALGIFTFIFFINASVSTPAFLSHLIIAF